MPKTHSHRARGHLGAWAEPGPAGRSPRGCGCARCHRCHRGGSTRGRAPGWWRWRRWQRLLPPPPPPRPAPACTGGAPPSSAALQGSERHRAGDSSVPKPPPCPQLWCSRLQGPPCPRATAVAQPNVPSDGGCCVPPHFCVPVSPCPQGGGTTGGHSQATRVSPETPRGLSPPRVPFMVGVVRDTFFLCLGDMARPDCKASGGG